MGINWEVVKSSLWTGAGGVVVGMLLLSYGFGFMSRTTAGKLANTKSEAAVIAVLAPACADKFRALPDVCGPNSDPRRKQGLLLQNARGIPGSHDHLAGQKLHGFGPDRRMCKPDSRTAEGREPQTVVAETVSGRSASLTVTCVA
jgi:hypothetical protein